MQFTSLPSLALAAGSLLSLAAAAPAPAPAAAAAAAAAPLAPRTDPSKLPSTITLYAKNNGAQVGCINGRGQFTRNMQWCYPIRVFYTTGVQANIKGYDYCVTSNGALECYTGGTAATGGQFYATGSLLTVNNTGTGTAFSINSWPDASDNVGVPTLLGTGGSYMQLTLSVQSTQG